MLYMLLSFTRTPSGIPTSAIPRQTNANVINPIPPSQAIARPGGAQLTAASTKSAPQESKVTKLQNFGLIVSPVSETRRRFGPIRSTFRPSTPGPVEPSVRLGVALRGRAGHLG